MRDYEEQPRDADPADEQTRPVTRVVDRPDETIVDVPEPARREPVRYGLSTTVVAVRKAQQVIWYIFGVVETLLALRFILLAIGANPANPFFTFVREVTNPLAAPFANLVETPRVGVSTLELGTIFGMIIYLLLAIAVTKLLDLVIPHGESY